MDTIKEIIKTILLAIDKKLENAPYDRTVKGRIIETLPNNKYKVLVSGKEFTVKAKSLHGINDVVYVCIPQNNTREMFIVNIY